MGLQFRHHEKRFSNPITKPQCHSGVFYVHAILAREQALRFPPPPPPPHSLHPTAKPEESLSPPRLNIGVLAGTRVFAFTFKKWRYPDIYRQLIRHRLEMRLKSTAVLKMQHAQTFCQVFKIITIQGLFFL